MRRKEPLVSGEVYHVYNRGAHKLQVFDDTDDYRRFLLLLFLGNHTGRIQLNNTLYLYQGRSLIEIFESEKPDKSLVSVLAYCLMPNHFHLVLRQKAENGISLFMKKIMTGYSMYRNIRHDHSGVVFQGRFKSVHVNNEAYFRYIFSYVHLNPASLVEKEWKEHDVQDKKRLSDFVSAYQYSSYIDYAVGRRPESSILSFSEAPDFLGSINDIEEMLSSIKDRP